MSNTNQEVSSIESTNEWKEFLTAKGYLSRGCLTYPQFNRSNHTDRRKAREDFEAKLVEEFISKHEILKDVFFGRIGNGKKIHRFSVSYINLRRQEYIPGEGYSGNSYSTKATVYAHSGCGSAKWTRSGMSALYVVGYGAKDITCKFCKPELRTKKTAPKTEKTGPGYKSYNWELVEKMLKDGDSIDHIYSLVNAESFPGEETVSKEDIIHIRDYNSGN